MKLIQEIIPIRDCEKNCIIERKPIDFIRNKYEDIRLKILRVLLFGFNRKEEQTPDK